MSQGNRWSRDECQVRCELYQLFRGDLCDHNGINDVFPVSRGVQVSPADLFKKRGPGGLSRWKIFSSRRIDVYDMSKGILHHFDGSDVV